MNFKGQTKKERMRAISKGKDCRVPLKKRGEDLREKIEEETLKFKEELKI